MQIQFIGMLSQLEEVVICFKFSNFAYANTVPPRLLRVCVVLLFALNLVTLLMQIQLTKSNIKSVASCYLL